MKAAQIVDLKKRWREQQDDVLFPDEVIVPSSCTLWQPSVLRSVLCQIGLSTQYWTLQCLITSWSTDGYASRHSGTDALRQVPRPAELALQPLGP